MIDTVHIFLPDVSIDDSVLSNHAHHFNDHSWSPVVTGYVRSMRVKANSRGTTIVGSLAKFLHGDNLHTLSRADVGLSIEKLSDELCIDAQRGHVKRVDIATTLRMSSHPANYLPLLAAAPRMMRVVYEGQTVFFRNRSMVILFYDKVAELNSRKHVHARTVDQRRAHRALLDTVRGLNLLRYEVQVRNMKQLFPHGLLASGLCKCGPYRDLVSLWENAYSGIVKTTPAADEITEFARAKELLEKLAAVGLRHIGGLNVALELVKQHKSLDRAQRCRLRAKLRSLAIMMSDQNGRLLLAELDGKIAEVAAAALAE